MMSDSTGQFSGRSRDHGLVALTAVMLGAFLVWAYVFELAEVSSGTGTVVPSSREQIIQSLEGGIVASVEVMEGDIVEAGQILAQLDPTQSVANVAEAEARYHAALATAARLRAEVTDSPVIEFPEALDNFPELIATEEALFVSRNNSLSEALGGLERELALLVSEVDITQSLQQTGAASLVELIRLQRQQAQVELEIARLRSDHLVAAREELAQANAEVAVQESIIRGRADQVARLTFRAPMRGVVKDIAVTTIGGVVPPNGQLMTIVPLDDQLMIEARISPRDIAFIHPQQKALVKISAYDYSIFGGLDGEVVTISPNTVRDEIKPEIHYYRVFIRTDKDGLVNKAGQRFGIVPGMVATVDIRTGSKTVWDYLIKPFNRAQEALRER